jgi:hypothetical protein
MITGFYPSLDERWDSGQSAAAVGLSKARPQSRSLRNDAYDRLIFGKLLPEDWRKRKRRREDGLKHRL